MPPERTSNVPRLDLRRVVHRAIAQKRHELSSHPAIGEAVKDVAIEHQRGSGPLRRQTSSDAALGTQAAAKLQPTQNELTVIYQDAEEESRRFRQAVELYELSDVPEHLKTSIISNACHTAEEAIQAASAVSDAHYAVRGFRGSIVRRLSNLFTNNISVISTWAEILPSQNEYFSIICGGLKLIFGAAARLKQMREEICNAIEEIPNLLARTSNILNMFEKHHLPRGSKLHEYSAAIMAGIISLLHHIVFELSKKKPISKRAAVCLLKQDKYGADLSQAVARLHASVEDFHTTAEDYTRFAVMDSRDAALEIRERLVISEEVTKQYRDEDRLLRMRTEPRITFVGDQHSEQMLALRDAQAEHKRDILEIEEKLENIHLENKLGWIALQREIQKANL